MKKLLLIALGFFSVNALAQAAPATLTFTPPTTRVDGSALPTAQIAGYDLECSGWTPTGGTRTTCPAGMLAPVTLPGTATGGTLTFTVPSTGGQAFLRIRTRDTAGLVSNWTTEVSKTFAPNPPNPPTNQTIAVVFGINMAPVYSVSTTGTRGTIVLGFVPVGLECRGALAFTYRNANWHYVADLPVKWWKSTARAEAAVPCGTT